MLEQFNSLVPKLQQSDKEIAFESKLEKFKSSFALRSAIPSKDKVRIKCKNIKSELHAGYGFEEGSVSSQNLLAFLLWELGERRQAFELIDVSISKDPTNIISLSNKARFLWDCRELSNSESILQALERLTCRSDYEDLKINAEAEIAYSLARLGPSCHQRAARLYETVIEVKPKLLWKFGLALTYKRLSNAVNAQFYLDAYKAKSTRRRSALLFCDIIRKKNDDGSRICARSWCELGDTVHSYPYVAKALEARFRLHVNEYFNRALQLCNDDTYVLQKYGKYLHCTGKFKESEKILRCSIRLRDSSLARHHLAQALMKPVALGIHRKTGKARVPGHIPSKQRQMFESKRKTGNVETITSTKEVVHSPNNKKLLEAKQHLQKALELEDGQFSQVCYDLGFTYRMLGKYQDAILQFSAIDRLEGASLVEQIRAKEQIGFTKLDMAQEDLPTEEHENIIKECEEVLFEVVQLQANTFEKSPNMRDAWKAYPTLLAITHSVKKKLHLHCLMKNDQAFELYQSLYDSNELDAEDHLRMIKMYEEFGNYDAAILILNNLLTAEHSIEATFIVSLYTKAAADSLSRGMFMEAVNRFNIVYHHIRHVRNSSEQTFEDIDIIIMHDCMDDPDVPCKQLLQMQKWLQLYIELNVTINDLDCKSGRPIQDYYQTKFDVCSTILVVFHGEKRESEKLYFVRNAACIPQYASKFVILSDEELGDDICFGNLPRLRLPKEDEEDGSGWIKEFIQHLQISDGDQNAHCD